MKTFRQKVQHLEVVIGQGFLRKFITVEPQGFISAGGGGGSLEWVWGRIGGEAWEGIVVLEVKKAQMRRKGDLEISRMMRVIDGHEGQ